MDGPLGSLVSRVFRLRNLMDAHVHIGLDDLTAEEAQVLELVELEQPHGSMDR